MRHCCEMQYNKALTNKATNIFSFISRRYKPYDNSITNESTVWERMHKHCQTVSVRCSYYRNRDHGFGIARDNLHMLLDVVDSRSVWISRIDTCYSINERCSAFFFFQSMLLMRPVWIKLFHWKATAFAKKFLKRIKFKLLYISVFLFLSRFGLVVDGRPGPATCLGRPRSLCSLVKQLKL